MGYEPDHQRFSTWLEKKTHLSSASIRSYVGSMRRFHQYLEENEESNRVSPDEEIRQLEHFITEKRFSDSSAIRYKTALKWWQEFSLSRVKRSLPQARKRTYIYDSASPSRDVDTFQARVVQMMKFELATGKLTGLRNACFVAFLQGTGMAVENALRLGVNTYRPSFHYQRLVGSRSRPMSYSAFLALSIWESIFPTDAYQSTSRYERGFRRPPLWPGSLTKERWSYFPMSRHAASNLTKRMSDDAHLDFTVTPGSLRDYFAEKAGFLPDDVFRARRMDREQSQTEPLGIPMLKEDFDTYLDLRLKRLEAARQVPGPWTTVGEKLVWANGEEVVFKKKLVESANELSYNPEADRNDRDSKS